MYYFASDIHLGQGAGLGDQACADREKLFVKWLWDVSVDAKAIFLLGDVFDFWFEYKRVIPKGFSRTLGALAALSDRGVEIHLFVGNHDLWAFDYLSTECGVKLHLEGETFELYGKKVYMAHGDNEPCAKPWIVNLMNKGFRSKFVQWAFSNLMHPDLALFLGQSWSGESRKKKNRTFVFRDDHPLFLYAKEQSEQANAADYYIFGHIHCAENIDIGHSRRVIFTGEWMVNPCYAKMTEDGQIELIKL